MFCPNCRTEYRPGFAKCSDCGAELQVILPPPDPQDPELNENERPDLASTRYFLAWFIPRCVYFILYFGVWARPILFKNIFVAVFLVCLSFTVNIGGFWMIYEAIRYEKRVGKYVVLAFVPFMFVWYSLVRVPLRKEFRGESDFIR